MEEQFAMHVLLFDSSMKYCGHAHVYDAPPGAIRHRCEQSPLLLPQGLGPVIRKSITL